MARTISPPSARACRAGEAEPPKATIDPEAYRLFLKGRMFLAGTPDELQQATDGFRQAIEREPLYAGAHASLAESYATQAYLVTQGREENVRKARAAVKRALRSPPTWRRLWPFPA